MELDFSKIDTLGSPQKPVDEPITTNYRNIPTSQETPVESEPEHNTHTLQRKSDKRKKLLDDSAKVLKEYQTNKRLTNGLVSEITKGIQQGADIYDLFLKAIEALALTTNETTLNDRITEDLKTVYGIGLRKPRALELEREDTQKRLESLTRALSDTQRVEDERRIKNAIIAHQRILESLQA